MKTGRPAKKSRTNFGERLCSLREAAGLSQQEIANHLNISQPSYAYWERNEVALKPDQLLRLASILNVSVEQLLQNENNHSSRSGPTGKARRVFEVVSQMPRHQQQKILEVVEALVERNSHAIKAA